MHKKVLVLVLQVLMLVLDPMLGAMYMCEPSGMCVCECVLVIANYLYFVWMLQL